MQMEQQQFSEFLSSIRGAARATGAPEAPFPSEEGWTARRCLTVDGCKDVSSSCKKLLEPGDVLTKLVDVGLPLFFSILPQGVAAQEQVSDFGDLKLCLCSSCFVQQ